MIQAVIFALDGVLVNTDECHYRAWKQLTEDQGIPYDRKISQKLQGMSYLDGLKLLLRKAERKYSPGEILALGARKNDLFAEQIADLGKKDILPGALETVQALKEKGIRVAIGSASENATGILRRLQMEKLFDAVADGNQITHGKPDPEVFLLAAKKLNLPPECCLVVEEGETGVVAAKRCGMQALAVGDAENCKDAAYHAPSLAQIDLAEMIESGAIA